MSGNTAVSAALCRLAGIDPGHVQSVWFDQMGPGEPATLTVKVRLLDVDGSLLVEDGEVVTALERYEWVYRAD